MATVQFFKDYTWENRPKKEIKRIMPLKVMVCRLKDLRTEWQNIAESEGKTLNEIQVGVGLLLYDFCNLLELLPEETQSVLGPELWEVVQ
jgi:hypothetical protein